MFFVFLLKFNKTHTMFCLFTSYCF